MTEENEHIKRLARLCAMKGLKLKDARSLFDALYIADALIVEDGNKTKAAQRAGMGRTHIMRMQKQR